jgi:hypothetical protein
VIAPKQLVHFKPTAEFDATPLVCGICQSHYIVSYGIHEGRVFLSLGCAVCQKGSMYAPNPPMTLEDLA